MRIEAATSRLGGSWLSEKPIETGCVVTDLHVEETKETQAVRTT